MTIIATPPAPCVIDPGTILDDFTNMASWTPDAQMSALTRHYRCLDQADKAGIVLGQPATATAQGWITKNGLSWDLHDMVSIRLDMMSPFVGANTINAGPTGQRICIEFSSTGNFAAKKMSSVDGGGHLSSFLRRGYSRWTVGLSEFTATGGESWANTMVACRIGYLTSTYMNPNTVSTYLLLDKLVKNPRSKGVLSLGIDTAFAAGFQTMLASLDAANLRTKAYTAGIDYDNVGDATYSTYADIVAAINGGLYCVPNLTAWLLSNAGCPNAARPVPPYHADDTAAYLDTSDSTFVNRLNAANVRLIWERTKEIHDFYGLPWNPEFQLFHAGNADDYESRLMWLERGVRLSGALGLSVSASYNYNQWASIPAPQAVLDPLDIGTVNTAIGLVSLAQAEAILDSCVLYGRMFSPNFYTGVGTQWTDADFQAFLAYAKAYETAGTLDILSVPDMITQLDGRNWGMVADVWNGTSWDKASLAVPNP
jgi:hypothetical protein